MWTSHHWLILLCVVFGLAPLLILLLGSERDCYRENPEVPMMGSATLAMLFLVGEFAILAVLSMFA